MNMILLFIICTTANVIFNTVKSIVTVKGGKIAAAAANAICFGFYTYIIILTANSDITTLWKIIITAACNFIGVYGVKLAEEKMRKDKLWKVEMTISAKDAETLHFNLSNHFIPNHYLIAGKHAVFSCFCESQEQTALTLKLGKEYHAKTFATETKIMG